MHETIKALIQENLPTVFAISIFLRKSLFIIRTAVWEPCHRASILFRTLEGRHFRKPLDLVRKCTRSDRWTQTIKRTA